MTDEERVGDLFDGALRKLGVRREVRLLQIQEAFAEVVGPTLSPLCRAVALERGALRIATAHSGLAHQLQLDAVRLIATLNQRIGADTVKRLRFTTMELPPGARR